MVVVADVIVVVVAGVAVVVVVVVAVAVVVIVVVVVVVSSSGSIRCSTGAVFWKCCHFQRQVWTLRRPKVILEMYRVSAKELCFGFHVLHFQNDHGTPQCLLMIRC